MELTAPDGRSTQGEIAPLPWFGSETLEAAIALCQAFPQPLTAEDIAAIPDTLPACQFGLESALLALQMPRLHGEWPDRDIAALLPAGSAALDALPNLIQTGARTLKWKIATESIAQELEIFHTLLQNLPPNTQLRLDANTGLSVTETEQWLQACADQPVEYLEQPLPIHAFKTMRDLSQRYSTPIALDESVATLHHLRTCYEQGWRGIYVIKPAIVGFPSQLRHFCQTTQIDTVFSSVFETAIGRRAGLQLARDCGTRRALGYGTADWLLENS